MPYFGNLCLDEISSYHLVEYRKQRVQEKGAKRKALVAPSTINRELGILRNMLRLASEWGMGFGARQSFYHLGHLSLVIGEKKKKIKPLYNRSGLPAPSGLPKIFHWD
jgi:hypothetical protein